MQINNAWPRTAAQTGGSAVRHMRKESDPQARFSTPKNSVKVLVIDVGGTHVKLVANGHRTPIKLPNGPLLAPGAMAQSVTPAAQDWKHDTVFIGFPGPVANCAVERERIGLTMWTGEHTR